MFNKGEGFPSTQRYYSSFSIYSFSCYMFRSYDHLQTELYTIIFYHPAALYSSITF
jgi:hypothetical protein